MGPSLISADKSFGFPRASGSEADRASQTLNIILGISTLVFLCVFAPNACLLILAFGFLMLTAAYAAHKTQRPAQISDTDVYRKRTRVHGDQRVTSGPTRDAEQAVGLAAALPAACDDMCLLDQFLGVDMNPVVPAMTGAADSPGAAPLKPPTAPRYGGFESPLYHGVSDGLSISLEASQSTSAPGSPERERFQVQWLSGRCSDFLFEEGASVRKIRERAGAECGVPPERVKLISGVDILGDDACAAEVASGGVLQGIVVDGWRAVTASCDNTLRVWDLLANSCAGVLEGHEDRVSTLSCDLGKQRAVSGSWDTTLRVWNLETAQCLGVLEGHTERVTAVVADFVTGVALSGSLDETMRLWHLDRMECLAVFGHGDGDLSLGRVVQLDADLSAGRALCRSDHGELTVWDVPHGRCIATLSDHAGWLTASACDMAARKALTGAFDGSLRLWDISDEALAAYEPIVSAGACSAFGATLGLGDDVASCKTMLSAAPTSMLLGPMSTLLGPHGGHKGAVNVIEADFDVKMLAVTGGPDGLRVWDLAGFTLIASIPLCGVVRAVAVDFDSMRAVCGTRGGLAVWDLSGAEDSIPLGGNLRVEDCAEYVCVPESNTSAAGALAGNCVRTDARRGQRGREVCQGLAEVPEAAPVRDISAVMADFKRRRAVTCSTDGTLHTWDFPEAPSTLAPDSYMAELAGHTKGVTALSAV